MGFKVLTSPKVISPESHLGSPEAEAVDSLAHELAKVIKDTSSKQVESNEKLISAISAVLKKEIKFPEPTKPPTYRMEIIERDKSGLAQVIIATPMTATPESVK